jgi:hypothetical protein
MAAAGCGRLKTAPVMAFMIFQNGTATLYLTQGKDYPWDYRRQSVADYQQGFSSFSQLILNLNRFAKQS